MAIAAKHVMESFIFSMVQTTLRASIVVTMYIHALAPAIRYYALLLYIVPIRHNNVTHPCICSLVPRPSQMAWVRG